MVPHGRGSALVRLVRGDEGEVQMDMELVLRFGYGATVPWVTRADRRLDSARSPGPTWWCCVVGDIAWRGFQDSRRVYRR